MDAVHCSHVPVLGHVRPSSLASLSSSSSAQSAFWVNFFIIGLTWPGECSDARMLANRPKPETELPPGAFHHDHHDCGDDDHYCDDREIIMTK